MPRLKARFPDAMADDDHGRRAGLGVGLREVTADYGSDSQRAEQSRRDSEASKALWISVGTGHGHAGVCVAFERFERGLLAAPIREVVIRDAVAPPSGGGRDNREVLDLLRLIERQSAQDGPL